MTDKATIDDIMKFAAALGVSPPEAEKMLRETVHDQVRNSRTEHPNPTPPIQPLPAGGTGI